MDNSQIKQAPHPLSGVVFGQTLTQPSQTWRPIHFFSSFYLLCYTEIFAYYAQYFPVTNLHFVTIIIVTDTQTTNPFLAFHRKDQHTPIEQSELLTVLLKNTIFIWNLHCDKRR